MGYNDSPLPFGLNLGVVEAGRSGIILGGNITTWKIYWQDTCEDE